jgi:aspartate/methionine/tyrosine aminotransferase
MNYKDITQHEIEALKHDFNVSDAHTHQSQSPSQKQIVARLPELWFEAEKMKYADIEKTFIQKFFEFRKQPSALINDTFLVAYSASVSTAIIAHYLSKKKMSVAVIEPCFDNLVDLLKLANNEPVSLPEDILFSKENVYKSLEETVNADAIYLTDPNNPTGRSLSAKGIKSWKEVVKFCKDYNKLLILDLCFTPFLHATPDYKHFDLYELLENSGISYITLEDTGKSWPIQDMKASILKSSIDVYEDLKNISTIYLLQVSPFALRVLCEYLDDAIVTGYEYTRNLILRNWNIARNNLEGTFVDIQNPDVIVPVIWCKLPKEIDGDELKTFLENRYNVHVVPGKYFFWSDPENNKGFIRIALARDPEIFEESMKALRNGLLEFITNNN